MKYGDLPAALGPTNVGIYCTECDEGPYSATRGDYFMYPDDLEVRCSCGAPMFLGRSIVTIERIDE